MNRIKAYSFCEPFIGNLVDYIEEHFFEKGRDLSRLAIVFGGKRPALFTKRELAKRLKASFYAPVFFTIDDFVNYTARKQEAFQPTQDLEICYALYHIAQKVAPQLLEKRKSFAQFLPWTREILAFIEQLDLEDVSEKALQNIKANAEIGYAVPDDINDLLQSIVLIRRDFQSLMEDQKTFSRGYQYLKAARSMDQVPFDEFDQILFCNFFYFHKTEERIVKALVDKHKATLIVQGDQRKWPVMERIARNFSCSIKEGEEPQPPEFNLKLYSGFDLHSQISHVREILKTVKNPSQTVIVLPNPDPIIPLLSEMTSIVKEFNISMGYPLKRSSLYALFQLVFKAQMSRRETRYYARDYLKVLHHPFVKNLNLNGQVSVTRILIHKIEEILTGKVRTELSGSLFLDLDEWEDHDDLYFITKDMLKEMDIKVSTPQLKTLLRDIHNHVFKEWEGISTFHDFAKVFDSLLNILTMKSNLKNYPLNLNIATKMYELKDELENVSFKQEQFLKEEIFKIFDGKVTRKLVSFIGSPLKGLQVLGLLETRALNFKNVIVMDVNEGTLPKLTIYEPLIPREVMISLNLDRLELEEEIQRYQFMRIISSAKNVHLVYQESREKEKSRFVEELIWERQKIAQSMDAVPVTKASFQVKVSPAKKVVRKTPAILKLMKEMSYSASSINTYIRDPMEFYTNYVLGLREQEDLLDEPEARHVGTFVHELLEESFKPFLNKRPNITTAFRNRFEKRFDQKFEETFGKAMRTDSFLLKSVLAERLNRFLDHEQMSDERDVEKLLYLEHRFVETIPLSCGEMKFKYIVDRIDQMRDGTVMIIDYKTGSIDQMPKAVDQIAAMSLSRESIRDQVKSFQIPLYFHYLNKQFQCQRVNAGLYNLRTLKIQKLLNEKTAFSKEHINETFMRALDFIVSEILNPAIPFESDEGLFASNFK